MKDDIREESAVVYARSEFVPPDEEHHRLNSYPENGSERRPRRHDPLIEGLNVFNRAAQARMAAELVNMGFRPDAIKRILKIDSEALNRLLRLKTDNFVRSPHAD